LNLTEYVRKNGTSSATVREYFQSLPGGKEIYNKYKRQIIEQYVSAMSFDEMHDWFLERLKEITPVPFKKPETGPQLSLF
jgi:uncharacterized protein (DUF885 family)